MNTATEDIRQEPLISKSWDFNVTEPTLYRSGIFITGANSFVGIHVVKLLEESWNGPVHLLVRAKDEYAAIKRMNDAFEFAALGEFNAKRYVMHTGNVCSCKMGLEEAEYMAIHKECGFVLHLAMNPVYYYPYKHFREIWLPELEQMIEFCGHPDFPKSLHYPSSFNAGFFTEPDDFTRLNSNAWQSGYAGFKWVANKVIGNAFDQGLNGCIYDIPLVLGSEGKGICPANYSIWHILEMFLTTGLFIDFRFQIIPVDQLAEIMVYNLNRDKKGHGQQFVRPVLNDPVTETLFRLPAARLLGLSYTSRDNLRELCPRKRKFDFLIPENFYDLLEKVNHIKAILPHGFEKTKLSGTYDVFYGNLMKVMQQQEIPS